MSRETRILKIWPRKASLFLMIFTCLGWLLIATGACTRSTDTRDELLAFISEGDAAFQQGRVADAEKAFRKALEMAETRREASPLSMKAQRDLSVSLDRLGDIARAQGKLPEAEKLFLRGLDIRKAQAKADPTNAQTQRDLSVSLMHLADISSTCRSRSEARELLQRAMSIIQKLQKASPNTVVYKNDLENIETELKKL